MWDSCDLMVALCAAQKSQRASQKCDIILAIYGQPESKISVHLCTG